MKYTLLFALNFSLVFFCNAQAYQINTYQSDYDTLTDYTSLSLELGLSGGDPYYWENEFEFDFFFPFYGEAYSSVIIDNDGTGYFPDSPEFNLFLFQAEYVIADIWDTTFLNSDVRYQLLEANGARALALEFHNVYNADELYENGENHYLNFQVWFFENGIIEIKFGDIDLANCSYYFPGEGFSFDNTDPVGNIYGPWVSINNNDFSEAACISEDFADPVILYDDDENCNTLFSIPEEGSVIQFLPIPSAINEVSYSAVKDYKVVFNEGAIEILGDLTNYESCRIFDLAGREIISSVENIINTDFNTAQILFVNINSRNQSEMHKLFVR